MKGAIGFLVGMIGLCLFASATLLITLVFNRNEGMVIFLFLLVVAFVFLNVLVVGFYRMLGHLHETVLYPEDSTYHPLRGRALFFVGYVGLLVTLVFVILLTILPELLRIGRFGRRDEYLLVIAWFAGWAFFGCLLGGVLMQLNDVYHKAFYRTMTSSPAHDDDLDITRRGPRRRSRRAEEDETARDWRDE